MTIVQVRGLFRGLYEWGTGWKQSPELWDAFWNVQTQKQFYYWRVEKHGEQVNITQKVCGASIYLHPMSFSFLTEGSGILNNEISTTKRALNELHSICSQAAKLYDATFTLYTSSCEIKTALVGDMDRFYPFEEE